MDIHIHPGFPRVLLSFAFAARSEIYACPLYIYVYYLSGLSMNLRSPLLRLSFPFPLFSLFPSPIYTALQDLYVSMTPELLTSATSRLLWLQRWHPIPFTGDAAQEQQNVSPRGTLQSPFLGTALDFSAYAGRTKNVRT